MIESGSDRSGGESVANTSGPSATRRVSRPDLVLAVIPAAFVVAMVVGQFLSIPLEVAMVTASLVCALAVFDGLFLNPPRRPRRPRSA